MQRWRALMMSPQCPQPAPSNSQSNPNPPLTPKQHPCTTQKLPPPQQMLWNFIQPFVTFPPMLANNASMQPAHTSPSSMHQTINNPDHPQQDTWPTSALPMLQPSQMDTENKGWGDCTQTNHPQGHFCIISKNMSTLNTYSLDMTAMATELKMVDMSIFCPRNWYSMDPYHTASDRLTMQCCLQTQETCNIIQ